MPNRVNGNNTHKEERYYEDERTRGLDEKSGIGKAADGRMTYNGRCSGEAEKAVYVKGNLRNQDIAGVDLKNNRQNFS